MEEFLYKLGIMTQKNNAELIQAIQNLQVGIEDLKNLQQKNFSVLADAINFNREEISNLNEKVDALAENMNTNHATLSNSVEKILSNNLTARKNLRNTFSNLESNLENLRYDTNKKIETFTEIINSNRIEVSNLDKKIKMRKPPVKPVV